ncbi:hypothetical protein T439DRAFT_357775 [Meredithblackwellia eburnea MCA 4105]
MSAPLSVIKSLPLDKVLGALLLGSWFNTVLFTIEIVYVWKYFTKCSNDKIMIKAAVAIGFSADIITTIIDWICIYSYNIKNWGNVNYLMVQPIVYYSMLLTGTVVSAFVSQVYLTSRVARLVERKWLKAILSFVFVGSSLTSVGSAIWLMRLLAKHNKYADRGMLTTPVIIWLATAAGCDVSLAATLVVLLLRIKASHPVSSLSTMAPVFKRLLIRCVETGSATAGVALLALICFLNDKESNTEAAMAWCLGRIYTLTILVNLLGRRQVNGHSSTSDAQSSSHTASRQKQGRNPGVHVSQLSHVTYDDPIPLDSLPQHASQNPQVLASVDCK